MAPRKKSPKRRTRLPRSEWALPLALASWMLVTGVRATTAEASALALAGLALLYGLLAVFLFLVARFAVRAGPAPGAGACLVLALVPAAQLRADAKALAHPLALGAFVVLVAAVSYAVLRAFAPRERRASPRLLAEAVLALLALGGATLLAARASEELRWHLFAHHRLFATPLYHLAARPIAAEREALWSTQGRLAQPAEHAPSPDPPVAFGKAPHVVFLLLDTLRADALAALGGAPDVMPRLNARTERAVLFSDVRANASWTRASCASIFTGLLPEEHGASRFHERLSEDWVTLPELLRAAGYQTAAFVANWVQVGRETGFAQGFDAPDFHELASADEILAEVGAGAQRGEVRAAYARAQSVNRAVLDWLASPARDPYAPLFLYVHYLDPHAPYLEPPEPGTPADARERRRGLYRQQLRYLDRELERLLGALEEALPGPKVVVVTSDHGEEFWEHDEWGHGHSLYRELLWVPLVVGLPDGRTGRVDAPLESRDLYSLVQELARDPGLDLSRWGAGHARAVRYASQYLDRVEGAHPDGRVTGLRRVDAGGASLIWSAFGPTWELYLEANDPGELENRVDRERARLGELRAELERCVRFWSAPTPVERGARELEFLRALGYAGGP